MGYLSSELKRDISIACVAATDHYILIEDFPRKVKASKEVWAIRLKHRFIDCRYQALQTRLGLEIRFTTKKYLEMEQRVDQEFRLRRNERAHKLDAGKVARMVTEFQASQPVDTWCRSQTRYSPTMRLSASSSRSP